MKHALLLAVLFVAPTFAADLWVDANAAAGGDGSPAKPFKTAAAALAAAKGPGDTVILKAGVYREKLPKLLSGEKGQPFTIKSAPGERATISAAAPVTDWVKGDGNVYTAVVDLMPRRLLLRNAELPIAREPNDGWWIAEGVTADSITDKDELPKLAADPAGATAYVWLQKGNTFGEFAVESLDKAAGTLAVKPGKQALTAGDKFYLRNKPQFVDRPGEWAAVPGEGGKVTLHYWPKDPAADLKDLEIPGKLGVVLLVEGGHDIVIDSLNIAGSARNGIELANKCSNITVSNCVLYNNLYMAFTARNTEDVTVRRCVSVRNEYGIAFAESKRALVEECEVAYNGTDGVLFTWNSDDVTLRKSYVHDHMLWGHPDNVQLYREVKGFKMLENLLITSGQSVMMEQTTAGKISGNTIIGSGAYMLIFGHKSAGDYDITHNTMAYPGYGAMNLSADDYRVHDNIFMTGHTKPAFGTKGVTGYVGERNVFWSGERIGAGKAQVLSSDKGFHRSLEQFQEATGQDKTSIFADPKFRNAPIASAVLDEKKLDQCTASKLFLRDGAASFKDGDHVELNFDGVKRVVKAVEGAAIVIEPALAERPIKTWIVANWGDKTDYVLDLRVKDDSPAAKLSDGKPAGSTIDIQAYKKGDFDGDGKRDLPPVPEGLLP